MKLRLQGVQYVCELRHLCLQWPLLGDHIKNGLSIFRIIIGHFEFLKKLTKVFIQLIYQQITFTTEG